MSTSYGFFDAVNLDRVYTAENFTEYLSSMICDGIQDTVGECFAVTYQEHTGFSVGTGKAWLGGHYFMNHSSYYLNLKAYQNSAMDRYVTIAIRCDLTERKCDIAMIPGTPADVPEPEFPENSDTQTFLTLATVLLPAGSEADQSCITDYRSDPSCMYIIVAQ